MYCVPVLRKKDSDPEPLLIILLQIMAFFLKMTKILELNLPQFFLHSKRKKTLKKMLLDLNPYCSQSWDPDFIKGRIRTRILKMRIRNTVTAHWAKLQKTRKATLKYLQSYNPLLKYAQKVVAICI